MLTYAPAVILADYTIFGLASDLLQSELKTKLLEVKKGHVPHCPIAGDATAWTDNENVST